MCLAIPGKIEEFTEALDDVFRLAKVNYDGVKKEVNMSMLPEAKVGDYVMVHVGVAISIVDEDEAKGSRLFEIIKLEFTVVNEDFIISK